MRVLSEPEASRLAFSESRVIQVTWVRFSIGCAGLVRRSTVVCNVREIDPDALVSSMELLDEHQIAGLAVYEGVEK